MADDELLFFQLPSILPQFEKNNDEPVEPADSKDTQLPPAAKNQPLKALWRPFLWVICHKVKWGR